MTPPSGARFYRCALQVNPHHYAEKYRGQASFVGSANEYVSAVLKGAHEEQVEVLGITDHHDVEAIAEFERQAEPLGIVILPGFEATSSEGIHVLCLFDPQTARDTLNKALGRIGHTDGSSTCEMRFVGLVREIDRLGGVAIAAHVHDDNGLLTKLDGRPRIDAWRSPYLHAAAITRPVEKLDQALRSIVTNKDAEHRRARGLALIFANDVTNPEDVRKASTRSMLKMTVPSAEGLRQAFLDPESRVREDGGDLAARWPRILRIRWLGGFLDGAEIRFNDNLNVLIGGRGTGKSAIVESLRFAFDLEAHQEKKREHESFLASVLQAGTSVTVEVESGGEVSRRYIIERTVPDPPRITDEDGAVKVGLRPRDVLKIELLGQGELALLAEDAVARTRLLTRFVEHDPTSDQKKVDLRRRLEKSRQQILELARDLEQDRDAAGKLVTIREQLRRFEGLDLEKKLQDRTQLGQERQLLDGVSGRISALRGAVEAPSGGLPLDPAFLSDEATLNLPGRPQLDRAAEILRRLSADAAGRLGAVMDVIATAEADLASVRLEWTARERLVEANYKQLLREMQAGGVRSGTDFVGLKDQLHALEPREARVKAGEDQIKKARESRATLLAEWDSNLQADFQRLVRAAKRPSALDRVRVQVRFRGDRSGLWKLLKKEIKSFSTERLEAIPADRLSPRALAEAMRAGLDALMADPFLLTRAQAEKLHGGGEGLAMQVEELELPPTTEIEFDAGAEGSPHWQTIEQLSKGQRASAILMILLLAGPGEATPLVVDQPEDDLDNRFVTDGIVPQLKRAKQERQFVFTTHNANLPVLGDAELIVTAATKVQGGAVVGYLDPERMGSIDVPSVRHSVEEILEGGKEAFELRRQKYHFEI